MPFLMLIFVFLGTKTICYKMLSNTRKQNVSPAETAT